MLKRSLRRLVMVEFKIHYPSAKKEKNRWSKQYGLNAIYAGKHWAVRQKDSQFWHNLVKVELLNQGIERLIFESQVHITFFWNDKLDIDNHAYMGKMIVDSLKDYLLADDSKRYLSGITHKFHKHDENYILVKMEGIKD